MTTRELAIRSIFEGKRSKYRISDKIMFSIYPIDTNSIVKYVDAVIEDRESLSDKLGDIEKKAFVSFSGKGEPMRIEFDGADMNNSSVEVEIFLDEFGEPFHYKFVKL